MFQNRQHVAGKGELLRSRFNPHRRRFPNVRALRVETAAPRLDHTGLKRGSLFRIPERFGQPFRWCPARRWNRSGARVVLIHRGGVLMRPLDCFLDFRVRNFAPPGGNAGPDFRQHGIIIQPGHNPQICHAKQCRMATVAARRGDGLQRLPVPLFNLPHGRNLPPVLFED